jgi:chorismate mutase/prephenate dehydratase
MENSDGGVVTQTLDNLMESHLKIIIKIATPNDATSTSYVVVSDFKNAQDEQAKTSFLVNLSNQYSAGSLFDFLADFKANAINIERIESKHAEYAKASPYSFYIEVHGHIDDENMKKVYETHQDTITWIGIM